MSEGAQWAWQYWGWSQAKQAQVRSWPQTRPRVGKVSHSMRQTGQLLQGAVWRTHGRGPQPACGIGAGAEPLQVLMGAGQGPPAGLSALLPLLLQEPESHGEWAVWLFPCDQ